MIVITCCCCCCHNAKEYGIYTLQSEAQFYSSYWLNIETLSRRVSLTCGALAPPPHLHTTSWSKTVTTHLPSITSQFGPAPNTKEFHIEYEWRIDSGETSINSAYNTLALKRLFNLGNTEFQRLSKQVRHHNVLVVSPVYIGQELFKRLSPVISYVNSE